MGFKVSLNSMMDHITSVLLVVITITLFELLPANGSESDVIIKLENESDGKGNYRFVYETSNGIRQEQTGEILNPGSDQETMAVRGFYSYVRDDGKVEEVHYIADKNGFQPVVSTSANAPNLTTIAESGAFAPAAALASLAGGGFG